MASALPHRPAVDHVPSDRTDIRIQEDDLGEIFQAMSSVTAQDLLAALNGDPSTASELADAVGTSLQNIQYHLDQLCDAGLVKAVGTWYSSRGTEMTVYTLSVQQLVVQFGDTEHDESAPTGE